MDGEGQSGFGEARRRLAELHGRQFDRMVRLAERLLPPPTTANAEDVVQTVFTEALVASLERPAVPIGEGWLIRRLRSRIADHHRRDGRQLRLLLAAVMPDQAPSPADVALDRTAVDDLLAAIPDPNDRLTLALRIHGYREAEIAERLGLSYEARQVRDRMKRIRRRVGAHQAAARRAGPPEPSLVRPDAGPRTALEGPLA